jgi:hypothetical protein
MTCLRLQTYPPHRCQCLYRRARVSQEFIDTDRFDFDLSLSYFLPDVVKDRLDTNIGLGFKFIYANGQRNFANGFPSPQLGTPPFGFLYFVCNENTNIISVATLASGACRLEDQVSQQSYLYAMTIPLSFNVHLTPDKKLYLPFNVSPLVGAETRNDYGVVYSTKTIANQLVIQREDGTAFAYGVTADVGARYVFDNGIALYGGFRVQFIEGHNQYLAWGPIVNMSVRFGK